MHQPPAQMSPSVVWDESTTHSENSYYEQVANGNYTQQSRPLHQTSTSGPPTQFATQEMSHDSMLLQSVPFYTQGQKGRPPPNTPSAQAQAFLHQYSCGPMQALHTSSQQCYTAASTSNSMTEGKMQQSVNASDHVSTLRQNHQRSASTASLGESGLASLGNLASSFGGIDGGGAGGMMAVAAAAAAAGSMGLQGSNMEDVAKGVAMGYLGKVDAYTGSTLALLRYYFAVNNQYVMSKLRVLALPYTRKEWERKQGSNGHLLPPMNDVNAPDLYLPLMGFVTYILAYGYALGAQGKFTPDVLGLSGTSGFGILLFEVLGIKLCFYLIQGSRVTFLEMASCAGYKFVGIVPILIIKQLFGTMIGYATLAMVSASIGYFMICTLRQAVMQSQGSFTPGLVTDGIGSSHTVRSQQKNVLWVVAGLQFVWSWYLCRV